MPPPAGRFSAAAYRAYLLRRHRRRRFPDGSLAEQKQRAISHAVISAGNEVSPRKVMSKSMDIRKVVLGGFVAATAVVLPVSAASAALATPAPPRHPSPLSITASTTATTSSRAAVVLAVRVVAASKAAGTRTSTRPRRRLRSSTTTSPVPAARASLATRLLRPSTPSSSRLA
jgi:hypothetical protein